MVTSFTCLPLLLNSCKEDIFLFFMGMMLLTIIPLFRNKHRENKQKKADPNTGRPSSKPLLNQNLNREIFLSTGASVFATVDMSLIKISRATPTTSLRVSPIVSPVTEALCAAEPLP